MTLKLNFGYVQSSHDVQFNSIINSADWNGQQIIQFSVLFPLKTSKNLEGIEKRPVAQSDLIVQVDVIQMEYRKIIILDTKRFYIWKVHRKKIRKIHVLNFFLSICVFCRPDKNDIINSKYRYKTDFLPSFYSKLCTK